VPDDELTSTITHDPTASEHGSEGLSAFRVVLVVASPSETRVIELDAGRSLTMGRGDPADIRIADPSLSRAHASLQRTGDAVTVADLGSRNGTVVFGKRIETAVLRGGDTAVLGKVTVSVQVLAPAAAAVLGLANYDTVLGELDDEWARARDARRPVSVVLLRPLGKAAVGDYASACVAGLGPLHRVGIHDPQSLLVLVPGADSAAAAGKAREWIQLARDRARLVCGVAAYPESGVTPEQLVSGALRAARRASAGDPIVIAPALASVLADVDRPAALAVVRVSAKMVELDRLVRRIAAGKIPVLVLGETGTGKEVVARDLHAQGPRHAGPLKIVNCAAIPQNLVESVLFGYVKGAFTGAERAKAGVLEEANGGTVLFDEVGELPPAAQAALLRALDSGHVCPVGSSVEVSLDVRVVAMTHRNLDEMVEKGTFRLDLLHRLNAFILEIPPLRDRPDEIAPLAACFVERLAGHYGGQVRRVSPEALAILERYRWPGNVRELRNVIERALTLATGDAIQPDDLPAHLTRLPEAPGRGLDLRAKVLEHETEVIRKALEQTGGHQARAARLLNIPLRTLERKLQKRASDDDDG
jgi:DNA-binding NtrC family response regulator